MRGMKSVFNFAAVLTLASTALVACDDDDGGENQVDAAVGVDGGAMVSVDTGVLPLADAGPIGAQPDGGNADAAPVVPPPTVSGVAVLLSDFKSISLTLVNHETGAVVKENCVNSGTVAPALTSAFSGDVVLPSTPFAGGKVVLIDRSNGTLTWVDPATCNVAKQISVATMFFANPQDAVQIGDFIFVSRYETNTKPTAAPGDFDEGGDILVVDAKTSLPVGRIDLAPYATTAAKTVLPRPGNLLVKNGILYVALGNIGPSFAIDEIGAGRVLAIDPVTRMVTGMFDASPLLNCGGSQSIVGSGGFLVTCNGNFKLMDGTQVNGSGLVWGNTGAAPMVLPASKFGRPTSASSVVLATATKGFVVVPGGFGGPKDAVWAFDLETMAVKSVFEGSGAYVLNNLLWIPGKNQLYVAHADEKTPRVVVLNAADLSSPTKVSEIDVSGKTGLPPAVFGWY